MAHKIYDKQGNIYFLLGSSVNTSSKKPKPLNTNKRIKQLATLLGQTLNVPLPEQQLVYLLGYKNCKDNHAVIMVWLSEQNIDDDNNIDFQVLYNKLVSELVDASNTSSSL